MIEEYFKEFVSIFKGASFHITPNVSIFKTGIDHWSLNFCFIKNQIEQKDIEFIRKKLDGPGLIFCQYNFSEEIFNVGQILYLGNFPLVKREEFPDFYKAPSYDDITILSVRHSPMIFDDFIDFFSNVRSIDKKETLDLINMDNLNINNHFFVAYMGDKVVGIFYFIRKEDTYFVIDSSIREDYENTGVYVAMLRAAKEEALKNEIFNYYSILTSDFSIRTAVNEGYELKNPYNIWKKS